LARVISRYLAPVYILLCLLLGGASSAGFLANGALQLAGLICLLIVVLGGFLPELPKPARNLLALIGLAAALLTFELIPLPPFLWSLLPGRGNIAEGYALLGMSRPWLPISLSTSGTLAALCALIPVVTVVVLTYVSSGYGRLFSVYLIIATAVASVVLGLTRYTTFMTSPIVAAWSGSSPTATISRLCCWPPSRSSVPWVSLLTAIRSRTTPRSGA
jgi:hypothetical protein